MKIWFDKLAPRTNAILGALLSGGDPVKLAKMFIGSEQKGEQGEDKDSENSVGGLIPVLTEK